MAHFAQIDENNKVVQVIVISNDEVHDKDGLENEALGVAFCQKLFGADTKWVATSYNHNKRGRFAGVGDLYDAENDVFVQEIRGEAVVLTPEMIAEFKAIKAAAEATPTA
jgi:hypothetical protein